MQGWDYQADAELWKQAPPFEYVMPTANLALRTHVVSVISLLCWFFLALVLALRSATRVKVV